jgi:CDP-glucose 4,6-dehydratase
MKNVLITGGTGFLGSYLAKRLVKQAESVTIVTLNIKQKTTLKALNVDMKKINLVQGDIRDFNFISLLFNEYEFDTVFHLGALSEVKKCQPNPKLAFETNIMGTVNILEAARLYGNVKAIAVSSSDKAYGSGELPYLETLPMEGRGVYEVSKSCTDLVARSYFYNYELPVVVTRCSNLYGGCDMNMSRIIPNTIRLALKNQSPLIWKGSEKATREFLYIEDAVDGYISLVKNIDKTKGEAFNIGSGETTNIEQLVNMILTKINPSLQINFQSKSFPEINHQYLDSQKIKDYTGWTSNTNLSEGLDETIKLYTNLL